MIRFRLKSSEYVSSVDLTNKMRMEIWGVEYYELDFITWDLIISDYSYVSGICIFKGKDGKRFGISAYRLPAYYFLLRRLSNFFVFRRDNANT